MLSKYLNINSVSFFSFGYQNCTPLSYVNKNYTEYQSIMKKVLFYQEKSTTPAFFIKKKVRTPLFAMTERVQRRKSVPTGEVTQDDTYFCR
jgi:hypothetical protein